MVVSAVPAILSPLGIRYYHPFTVAAVRTVMTSALQQSSVLPLNRVIWGVNTETRIIM